MDEPGLTNTPSEAVRVSPEEDKRNESIAHAMKLLLSARDRVLTLSDQRVRLSFEFLSARVDFPSLIAPHSSDPSSHINAHGDITRPRTYRLHQPLARVPALPLAHVRTAL